MLAFFLPPPALLLLLYSRNSFLLYSDMSSFPPQGFKKGPGALSHNPRFHSPGEHTLES